MRKFLGGSLLVSAAAGAIALSAPAAFAAGWTVTNPNPDGNFTLELEPGTTASFSDTATGSSATCSASTLNGRAPSGIGLSNPIGEIISGDVTDCTGPLGSTASGTIASGDLDAESYDAGTDQLSGVLYVTITISVNSVLGTCTGTASGGLDWTYDESTGVFTITGPDPVQPLRITNSSGNCAGLFNAGDTVSFTGTYVCVDPVPCVTFRPS